MPVRKTVNFLHVLELRRFGDEGSRKGINFLLRLEGHGDHPEKGEYKNANDNNLDTNIKKLQRNFY
jgi:hypothetical protein